jgi:hypothetical protein
MQPRGLTQALGREIANPVVPLNYGAGEGETSSRKECILVMKTPNGMCLLTLAFWASMDDAIASMACYCNAAGEGVLFIVFADDDKGKQEKVLKRMGFEPGHEQEEMTVGSGGREEGVRMVKENLPREEGSVFKELKKDGQVLYRSVLHVFA